MKASDFRTKRYLMGFVVSNGEKVYSDAFRTKRELIGYQSSDFHQWCVGHFTNLSYFVEYHERRGFVASDYNYIKARKYQILALKRAWFGHSSFAKQMQFCAKHKAYFNEAIGCNSLYEMRSIPC